MTRLTVRHLSKCSDVREEGPAPSRPREIVGILQSLLLFPFCIFGYIGAGTGSLILQVVIASSLGALVVVKIYWRRIVAFFKRDKESADVEE